MRGRLTRKEFMRAAGLTAGALVSGGLIEAVSALPAQAFEGDDHEAPGPVRPIRLSPFPGAPLTSRNRDWQYSDWGRPGRTDTRYKRG